MGRFEYALSSVLQRVEARRIKSRTDALILQSSAAFVFSKLQEVLNDLQNYECELLRLSLA
jgi:hypothetical protein